MPLASHSDRPWRCASAEPQVCRPRQPLRNSRGEYYHQLSFTCAFSHQGGQIHADWDNDTEKTNGRVWVYECSPHADKATCDKESCLEICVSRSRRHAGVRNKKRKTSLEPLELRQRWRRSHPFCRQSLSWSDVGHTHDELAGAGVVPYRHLSVPAHPRHRFCLSSTWWNGCMAS